MRSAQRVDRSFEPLTEVGKLDMSLHVEAMESEVILSLVHWTISVGFIVDIENLQIPFFLYEMGKSLSL